MKNSIRLRYGLVMAVLMVLSLLAFAFSMQVSTKAKADASIFTEQQTHIRVKTAESEISGIRFTAFVDLTGSEISKNAEFGLLIAKTSDLVGSELDFDQENATKVKAAVFIETGENAFKYQVVINGIPVSDYGVAITAVPYVIDGETVIIADQSQSRSLAQVASALIARGDVDVEEVIAYVDGVTDANSLTVTEQNVEMVVGDEQALSVAVSPDYLVPSYYSNDTTVVTVADGVLTAVGTGTATVTVSLGSIEKTVSVTVEEPFIPDAEDAEAVTHIFAQGSIKWGGCNTDAEAIAYEKTDLVKPADLTGDSLVKYTYTTSSAAVVNTMPLRYDSLRPFTAEQKTYDFAKIAVSFYVYNATGVALTAYLCNSAAIYPASANYGSRSVPNGQWTLVNFILTDLNITASKYDVCIYLNGSIAAGSEVNYYIDGVTVYEAFIPDADDSVAITHLFASGSTRWGGCTTEAEIIPYSDSELTAPSEVTGESVIMYSYTSTGGWVNSMPLRYDSVRPFTAEQKAIDPAKVHIRFYVYNAESVTLTAYLCNSAAIYFNSANKATQQLPAKTWTKVDFSLADFDLNSSYDVCIYIGGNITAGAGATYYIDAVTVYEAFIPDAEDSAALIHLFATGSTRWSGCTTAAEAIKYSDSGLTAPSGVTGDSLIKYDYTSTNTSGGMLLNSVPLRYTGGPQAFTAEQKTYDFTKVHLSFWIYNPNSFNIPVYAVKGIAAYFTQNWGSVTATAGQWTKVDFDLSSYAIDPNGSYDVVIGLGGDRFNASSITYFIDAVTLYEAE